MARVPTAAPVHDAGATLGSTVRSDMASGGVETSEEGGGTPLPLRWPTLGQIVGYYKYQSSKEINRVRENAGTPFWQRSFYEHIIRNSSELDAIRKYVAQNPVRRDLDRDNPDDVDAHWPG